MFLKSLFFLLLISPMSLAADYSIFEVRKSLPMENGEAAYKDYYINAGNEAGIKKGMYVGVLRTSNVLDPVKNTNQGSLKIQIAKLQIIQVDKHISVGRIAIQNSNDERPSVEFEGVMIGDLLDMDSASMAAPASKSKRKAAAADMDSDEDTSLTKATEKISSAKALTLVVAQPLLPVKLGVEIKASNEAKVPPVVNALAPEMVKVAVPPPSPQSNLNDAKKAEKTL